MTRILRGRTRYGWRHYCGIRRVHVAMQVFAFLALSALLGALTSAQSTSLLNGSVSDPSGASVAGAKITLTDEATGAQRTATSNTAGFYQFLDMPPGNYKLEATASGFANFVASNITLVVKGPIQNPSTKFTTNITFMQINLLNS